jgi:hypothetical protein
MILRLKPERHSVIRNDQRRSDYRRHRVDRRQTGQRWYRYGPQRASLRVARDPTDTVGLPQINEMATSRSCSSGLSLMRSRLYIFGTGGVSRNAKFRIDTTDKRGNLLLLAEYTSVAPKQ